MNDSLADFMATQLNSVRLKLEQRRRRIEEEKKKMESIMAKQREKVGQEAFLRAVGVKSNSNAVRLSDLFLFSTFSEMHNPCL